MASAESGERLFFALWPDDETRARLNATLTPLLVDVDGRHVAAANWHVTLAFLGSLTVAQRACAERVAETLSADPFELSFNQLGYFSKPQVVWIGSATCPTTLTHLVDALRSGLSDCQLPVESRPFLPHLTLMRKVRRRPRLSDPGAFSWRVSSFVLVRSLLDSAGATYEVIRSWPLSAPKSDS